MFNKRRTGALFGWLCSCTFMSIPALAQQPVLELKELLSHISNNAPALIADSMSIAIKQAQETSTRYNRLPALKLNYQVDAGTNNNMPGGYFSYGVVPGNSKVRVEGNSSTVLGDLGIASFDWEFYNFGGFEAQQKAAHSDVQVEQARFAQSKYQWQAYTINAYLQLIRLNNLLGIQLQNIERNTEIRRSIQALAQSGIIAGVDTSIAEAELSKARLNYLELTKQFKQIQIQLSALSGIISERIIPDTSVATQLMQYAKNLLLENPDTLNHPVIRFYKSLYQNSLDKEALIKRSYNPKVSLQGAVWGRGSSVSAADEFRSLETGLGFERGNYLVGVGIIYNLFDIKRKNLQLNIQKASSGYAQKKLDEQQSLLSLGINQADAELQIARERLDEIPHQLAAAQAAYRQKFSLYKNGLTNIVDLNAALTTLYRAETDFTNANFLYCRALFEKAVNENQVDLFLDSIK